MNELQTWVVAVSASAAAITWALKTLRGVREPLPRNGEMERLRGHIEALRIIVERLDKTLATREDLNAAAEKNRHATRNDLAPLSLQIGLILTVVQQIEAIISPAQDYSSRRRL